MTKINLRRIVKEQLDAVLNEKYGSKEIANNIKDIFHKDNAFYNLFIEDLKKIHSVVQENIDDRVERNGDYMLSKQDMLLVSQYLTDRILKYLLMENKRKLFTTEYSKEYTEDGKHSVKN